MDFTPPRPENTSPPTAPKAAMQLKPFAIICTILAIIICGAACLFVIQLNLKSLTKDADTSGASSSNFTQNSASNPK